MNAKTQFRCQIRRLLGVSESRANLQRHQGHHHRVAYRYMSGCPTHAKPEAVSQPANHTKFNDFLEMLTYFYDVCRLFVNVDDFEHFWRILMNFKNVPRDLGPRDSRFGMFVIILKAATSVIVK